MKTLFKNANIINVFTSEIEKTNFLVDGKSFVGFGDYYVESDADCIVDLKEKFVCPGFIDAHVHIESSMMLPHMMAKSCLLHGTTTIISDPHEIANVCGKDGIRFMLEASKDIDFNVLITLPSCVPATPFDENGATLLASDIEEFFYEPRVIGLSEMMNYVGVCNGDSEVYKKINLAKSLNSAINGHSPLLFGKMLDKYIFAGIGDDHECSTFQEALEKLKKGMHIMIREGTSAKNLEKLMPLFDEKYASYCMLVSDDKHPADIIENGHIDSIIRKAIKLGASPITAIKMATLYPAKYFNLRSLGAIAPGYDADFLVFSDLSDIKIESVYFNGKLKVKNSEIVSFNDPVLPAKLYERVTNTFNLEPLTKENFIIKPQPDKKARIIEIVKHELLTNQIIDYLDFSNGNGISTQKDVLKISVIERHKRTGHVAVGFIKGIGLKRGAISSSVSHDSHNIITIGTNEEDMAFATNKIIEFGGGCVVCDSGKVVAKLPLPIAGLMSNLSAEEIAELNQSLRSGFYALSENLEVEPFMTMSFASLPVIPHIKITTKGLFDVNNQKYLDLFVD